MPARPADSAQRTPVAHARLQGRAAERGILDAYAAGLADGGPSLVLVGEAGIGKTALWRYGVARCRAAGALVLECPAAEEDHELAAQGLRDLIGGEGGRGLAILAPDLTVTERARLLLQHLAALATDAPVVLAVDDVPWLDDLTLRLLRFCLRRLPPARVTLLATARTWSALDPARAVSLPDLGVEVNRVEIGRMPARDLVQLVLGAQAGLTRARAREVGRLAHGNPLFALELARRGRVLTGCESGVSLMSALGDRLASLPDDTRQLVRLLAVAGPLSIPVLRSAGLPAPEAAVRFGVSSDTVTVGDDFVVRFAHPLLATAVLDRLTPLDRRELHAALADAVDDIDARAVHLARATIEPDTGVALALAEAARRLSRRGAPRLAADLLADSVRLTPRTDAETRTRRVLARMRACATAGDLGAAIELSERLLAELEPGPLRAEAIAGRVELDFVDAEQFLRATLAELPDDGGAELIRLRGRLLGLLGWLLTLHLARIAEGLEFARAGLAIGRLHDDAGLTAQAAATVSTASLMAGAREDALIDEAVALDVPGRHMVMWPRVLLARQQLWDGRLAEARANHEAMYRRTVALGAELQRGYRFCDLAHVEIAAGRLDLAARHVEDGTELATESNDRRAVTWFAYPAGVLAALRSDEDAARAQAELLDDWASRVGDRPRSAMAWHIRGTLAMSRRDWNGGLGRLLGAIDVLDDLGVEHPGLVPVLPQAVLCAAMAEEAGQVGELAGRLERASEALRAPWVTAQAAAAAGVRQWLQDEPEALDTLLGAWSRLSALGYRLDAARLGCVVAAAGLRWGQRRRIRSTVEDAVTTLTQQRVAGWRELAGELLDRVAGTAAAPELTTTEAQIAELVAAGRRNREIGGELFVSESTVESHLTRIYRKLGLRNRAELVHALRPAAG